MFQLAIFGAKSIALGTCRAIQQLHNDMEVTGFLVSSKANNPDMLAGLPVWELGDYPDKRVCVLIATPEDTHAEIIRLLEEKGFHNHICVDSAEEAELMGRFYQQTGKFQLLHTG